MSEDSAERTSLSTWRTAGSMIASLIITVLGPLIVFVDNKIDANRVFMAALMFGILAISCYIACFKLTQERIHVIKKRSEQNKSFQNNL